MFYKVSLQIYSIHLFIHMLWQKCMLMTKIASTSVIDAWQILVFHFAVENVIYQNSFEALLKMSLDISVDAKTGVFAHI